MVVIHCCALLIEPACQVNMCLATRFDAVSCLLRTITISNHPKTVIVIPKVAELSVEKYMLVLKVWGESTMINRVGSCSNNKIPALSCQDSLTDTAARSNKQRSPASLWHTQRLSVRFWQKKHFVSSLFQIKRSLFFTQLTHYPFHTSTNSTSRERGKLSPLPTVNISLREHMVYTVKHLSCKCYKLSSQNVHITQFNVVCCHVMVSVCVCWRVCTVQY